MTDHGDGPDDHELRREFRLFARHISGRRANDEMARRYAHYIRSNGSAGENSAALNAVRAQPACLVWLDAGCALARPKDVLRQRLLLTSAILEASVEFADDFLPRHQSRSTILATVISQGAKAAFRALVGVPMLLWIERQEGKR